MEARTILSFENRLDLKAAAKRLGVHLNTIMRWRISGVQGVKLRCQRIGGRFFTCKQWLDEFVSALNDMKPAPTQRPDIAERCRAAGV